MKKIFSIIVILSWISTLPSFSQLDSVNYLYAVSDTLEENIKLFESNELLEISLKFDITHYRRNKDDTEYLPAVLTYHTSPTDSIVKTLRLKSRGISRLSICSFPPLMLNFQKQDAVEGEFSKVDKIFWYECCCS